MIRNQRFAAAILVVIFMPGCEIVAPLVMMGAEGLSHRSQGSLDTRTIDWNELESVKTIALLDIPDPNGPDNYNWKYGDFSLDYGDFSFGKILQDFLRQFLKENGYQVIEYTANRKYKSELITKSSFINDYEKLDIEGADAYLDIVPAEVKYRQRGPYAKDQSVAPHLRVVFRLVSASTSEVIWAGTVVYTRYGHGYRLAKWSINILSPDDHRYKSPETLNMNKEEAFQRLVYGIEVISASIVKNITEGEFVSELSAPVKKILSDNEQFTDTFVLPSRETPKL